MFDIAHFFIGTAWAQTAATPSASGSGSPMASLTNFLPLILIFAVFYMLIIRPQQKKLDEQSKMIKALQRGDRVVTTGGIHGKVAQIEEGKTITLEIATGVEIKIDRDNIQALEAKPEPVKEGDKK